MADFSIAVTDNNIRVSETGSTDSLTVVLDRQPLSNVVLVVASQDTDEATVNKSQLQFTPQNWNAPQTVVVTGVDDDAVDGTQATDVTVQINVGQSNAAFANVGLQSIAVETLDNDAAGFTITESNNETVVNESGTTDSFHVVLDRRPLSNVVIGIEGSDSDEAVANRQSLTFTPQDWDQPQTVIITGQDDILIDGDQ